ncbi:MAG TPA: VCBS repeat-containing protein, partial [Acidimicrobiales bacterium]
KVTVLLSNGNGTFDPVTTTLSGVPLSFTSGDFNGDGKTDIVVTYRTSSADLLLGNGDGAFQAAQPIGAIGSDMTVVSGDVNGDGISDLVGFQLSNIVVLLGNRDGVLTPGSTDTVPFGANNIRVADVTGDGRPDLVLTVPFQDGFVGLLTGNGDGTFGPASLITTPDNVYTLAVGDVNGDGVPDAVIQGSYARGGAIDVFLGNQGGSLGLATTLTAFNSANAVGIAVADLDRDGNADIAFASNDLGVYPGNGDGTFGPRLDFAASNLIENLVVGDFNGDGRPDVALANINDGTVGFFFGSRGDFAGQTYVIDSTPPTATITAEPLPVMTGTTATFAFTGVDPTSGGVSAGVAGFEVSLDGAPFIPATSPTTFAGLSAGDHQFAVRAVDAAGNVGMPATYDWTVNPNAAPTVLGISLAAPAAALSDAGSVSFTVVFDGPVTGVAASDFHPVLTGTIVTAAPIVVGSGDTYTVTVPGIVGDGTVGLQIVDDDSILSAPGAAPLGGPGIGNGDFLGSAVYSIDQTGPLSSIDEEPASLTNSPSATFAFSAVDPTIGGIASGVVRIEYKLDGGDFIPAVRPVTLSDLYSGSHTLEVRAVDAVGNVGPTVSYTWTADLTAPLVESIILASPGETATNAVSVKYEVTFSEPVTGVDATDFQVGTSGAATGSVSSVIGSGASYVVTVVGIGGDGELGLN